MVLRKVHRRDVEAMSAWLLSRGLAPKTVANTLKILHGVFEHAIDLEWTNDNPARRAARRRHVRDTDPDLRFLTLEELEAVLRGIPDEVVVRTPAPYRAGRRGPAPPPPPDVLGPVLRVLVLTAAFSGLRQGELLGLRWRDVDWTVQRIRVRQTWRRTEFSGRGKSDLSTRRSVRMADGVLAELDAWSKRSLYTGNDDLVFAHPELGTPLDGAKVTKTFQDACRTAGVRFHDLRHTFATRLASAGAPLRAIQDFLGHAGAKTPRSTPTTLRTSSRSHGQRRVPAAGADRGGGGEGAEAPRPLASSRAKAKLEPRREHLQRLRRGLDPLQHLDRILLGQVDLRRAPPAPLRDLALDVQRERLSHRPLPKRPPVLRAPLVVHPHASRLPHRPLRTPLVLNPPPPTLSHARYVAP